MSEAGGVEDGGGSAAGQLVVPEIRESPTPTPGESAEPGAYSAAYTQLKTPVGVYNGNLGRRATLVFSRGGGGSGSGSAVGTSGDHCEDEASVGRGGLYVETTALRAHSRQL